MDNVEPSTSSAAATTPANPTERAAAGSDVPQGASWLKGGSDSPRRRREGHVLGDNEQVVQEVPKKSSSIRFRHKLKKAKRPVSKGVWLPSLQAVSQTLALIGIWTMSLSAMVWLVFNSFTQLLLSLFCANLCMDSFLVF